MVNIGQMSSRGDLFEKWIRFVLLGACAAAVLVTLGYQISALVFRYPLDYGEAVIVDISMRLLRGINIYPIDLSKPDFIIVNYTPLFMLAQAPFIALFGPLFWQGRMISILSSWVASYYLGRMIYEHSRDRLAAVVTGMLFLAFPYVLQWSALARVDTLALALGISGLFFLTRQELKWRDFWLGVILLTAAIYTRQSDLLAIPAAAFFWLLFKDWRKALLLAAAVGGLGLLVFLILNLLTSGGFFLHIIKANLNQISLDRILYYFRYNLVYLAGPLGLAAVGAVLLPGGNKKFNAALVPFLAGAGISALTIGKVGSNYNYFLELCAALSLAGGMLLAWARQNRKIFQLLVMFLLIAQVGLFLNRDFRQQIPRLQSRWAMLADLRKLEQVVASTQGTVVADEFLGLITMQNRLLYIQPFASTQAAYDGLWDQTPFVQSIQARQFPLILVYNTGDNSRQVDRWTGEMMAAIEANYISTEIIANERLYRPKP